MGVRKGGRLQSWAEWVVSYGVAERSKVVRAYKLTDTENKTGRIEARGVDFRADAARRAACQRTAIE